MHFQAFSDLLQKQGGRRGNLFTQITVFVPINLHNWMNKTKTRLAGTTIPGNIF